MDNVAIAEAQLQQASTDAKDEEDVFGMPSLILFPSRHVHQSGQQALPRPVRSHRKTDC